VYNLQRKTEYQRTWQHIDLHWHEILQQAVLEGDPEILIQPLRGFPRRGQQPNYSAYDIYEDLRRQYQRGEDFLDSKIGRWNRLFEDWPDITVEFLEPEAKNQFSNIFV
jgi:hypothetical protein